MKINGIHQHIDNGGVTVEVHQTDDVHRNLSVTLNTSYFGYPDITSVLHLQGDLGSRFLKELGEMLIKSAEIVDSQKGIMG